MATAAPTPAVGVPSAAPAAKARARNSDFNAAAHGLRGIASLMVFFAHLLHGTAEHVYTSNADYMAAIQMPWHFGTYGVELFFAISGFVILPSVMRYSMREFAIRRFLRLYPLFFVLSVVFVILNGMTNEYPKLNTWPAIMSGFLFLNLFNGTEQLTPNAWSLTYEVIFYALVATGVRFMVKGWSLWGAFAVLALSGMFLLHYPIATYFLFGLGVRVFHDRGLTIAPHVARLIEIAAAMACVYFASIADYAYKPGSFADPSVIALMTATGSYFFAASLPGSFTARLLNYRAINYLGTVSYSLYLVHPYTYYLCRIAFVRLGLFGDNIAPSVLLFFVVTTPVTLAVTHVVHRWLEVLPYKRYFHQSIYRSVRRPSQDAGDRPA